MKRLFRDCQNLLNRCHFEPLNALIRFQHVARGKHSCIFKTCRMRTQRGLRSQGQERDAPVHCHGFHRRSGREVKWPGSVQKLYDFHGQGCRHTKGSEPDEYNRGKSRHMIFVVVGDGERD